MATTNKYQVAPPDTTADDQKYVAWFNVHEDVRRATQAECTALGFDLYNPLLFYHVTGMGWVLTTLQISRARGRQATDRYYGIRCDNEQVVRVGKGPHVTKEVTVYLSPVNFERLKKYIVLFQKGAGRAGTIRDRISSRRAEGQERRANGERSWLWSN